MKNYVNENQCAMLLVEHHIERAEQIADRKIRQLVFQLCAKITLGYATTRCAEYGGCISYTKAAR